MISEPPDDSVWLEITLVVERQTERLGHRLVPDAAAGDVEARREVRVGGHRRLGT